MEQQKYAEKCGECQYIFPRENKKNGFCDRLDDTNYIFLVPLDRTECLYGTPGLKIPQEEINNRIKESKLASQKFLDNLENAKKEIDSWPQWKKDWGKQWIASLRH